MTYWALGSREMVGVEFLHNVGQIVIPKTEAERSANFSIQASSGACFLFAPVKVRDCHGGPGRAIVLY